MSERIGEHFGNYRLTRLLGKGGFAETYLGEHTYLQTFAAVKILHAQFTPFDQEAFFSEARTIARLKHPNIIRVLDFGVQNDMPYLIMDYAPHGTLGQRHPRGEPLPLPVVAPYVKQVAAALHYAHSQKIIHRDVKPENMLLGEVDEVLLGDFGVATIVLTTLWPQARNVAGTVAYMAPEQLQGQPQPASDQYALGVVVYEWLTGVVPFRGTYSEVAMQHERKPPPPLRDLCTTIPLDVEEVVLTALSKDPWQRFGSVQAFANALEQASFSSASTLPMSQTFSSSPLLFSGDDPQVYLSTTTAAYRHAPPQPATASREQTASGSPRYDNSSGIPVSSGSSPAMSPAATPKLTPPLAPIGQAQSLSPAVAPLQASFRLASIALPGKILLSIVALLLLISIGFTYYAAAYRPNQLQAEAIATANRLHTEATATAAARAIQNSPQKLYQYITSSPPTWTDPLTHADTYNWWDQPVTDKNGNIEYGCKYMQGAFYGIASPGNFAECSASGTNFSNFLYQVQMTIVQGHTGGLEFRCDPVTGDSYDFRISTDGIYIFEKLPSNGKGGYNHVTITSGASAAIKQGLNQTNTLAVIARGSTFYFYVNGQYVTNASDSTYRTGNIGVYVDSDTGMVSAYFRNAQVWTPANW
jgi:serine/threonine protein kinase